MSQYFPEEIYSADSQNSRSARTTPIRNKFMLNNINTTRHYETNTRDGLSPLDIRNINHEAILNDPEIRSLSRKPNIFNRYSQSFYEEDESDEDTYAEVEMLVNNPAEEFRIRRLNELRERSSQHLEEETEPATPRLVHTFHSMDEEDADDNINEINIENDEPINNTKEQQQSHTTAYATFKPIAFFLFMIYWVISEPTIRAMAFITMLFSAIVFSPMKHVWSMLPPIKSMRKKIAPWFVLIVLIACIIKIAFNVKPYLNNTSLKQLIPRLESGTKLIELDNEIKRLLDDRTKLFSVLEKMQNQDIKDIWTLLDEQQEQINQLKEMMSQDTDLIQNAIQHYHQDVLNIADFALESRGARVLLSLTSPTYYPSSGFMRSIRHFFGFDSSLNPPTTAITPGIHVGECWSMYGNHGNLTILLSEPIAVEAITIEYPSSEVMAENMSTAPKTIQVYGINHYYQSTHPTFLGEFTYDIHKETSIQTFDIVLKQTKSFRAITFSIQSNWGSKERTDIYRIRVHGTPE